MDKYNTGKIGSFCGVSNKNYNLIMCEDKMVI